jgi:hypothetical protein
MPAVLGVKSAWAWRDRAIGRGRRSQPRAGEQLRAGGHGNSSPAAGPLTGAGSMAGGVDREGVTGMSRWGNPDIFLVCTLRHHNQRLTLR